MKKSTMRKKLIKLANEELSDMGFHDFLHTIIKKFDYADEEDAADIFNYYKINAFHCLCDHYKGKTYDLLGR